MNRVPVLSWIAAACLVSVPTAASLQALDGQQKGARLVLEALDGSLSELPVGGLRLSDPRERGAWLLRPAGFPTDVESRAGSAQSGGVAAEIELASGDVLLGNILGGEGELLRFELSGGIGLDLDLARIHSIRLPEQLGGESDALRTPSEGDRLYRRTRGAAGVLDPTDGTFDSFTPDGLRFESRALGLRLHTWNEIAALTLEILDDPRERVVALGVPVVLDLEDGGRVGAALLLLEETGCRVLVAGVEVFLAWGAVNELRVADGTLVFLSDLVATSEEGSGSPFLVSGDNLGMAWSHRRDRNVLGDTLRTAERAFRHGIGMHAPTRVAWRLDGEYRQLRGSVGIDDSTARHPPGARGSVIFRVLLDGKLAWESGVVKSEEKPLPMPALALTGVTDLVLEVDPAGDFRGDRANWLRPVLTR